MSKDNEISCDKHGKSNLAYICCHLSESGLEKGIGFAESTIREEGSLYAWCESCDKNLEKAGEWSELLTKKSNFKRVCDDCYEEVFDYQFEVAPDKVFIDYKPENPNVSEMYDVAAKFIDLANSQKIENMAHVSEALTFACSRFSTFEAVNYAFNGDKDKKESIE